MTYSQLSPPAVRVTWYALVTSGVKVVLESFQPGPESGEVAVSAESGTGVVVVVVEVDDVDVEVVVVDGCETRLGGGKIVRTGSAEVAGT